MEQRSVYTSYFNYSSHFADGYFDRHSFIRHWWRIYHGDIRWTPPYFPKLYDTIVRQRSVHVANMRPQYIHMNALRDNRKPTKDGLHKPATALFETTVGACAILCDPRREDRTAYLGLLHMVNDPPSFRRFVDLAIEHAGQLGYHRLVGPTGFSPHLQRGVLMDHFDRIPPLHSPYNPPYVPEIVQGALRPYRASHLYAMDMASAQIVAGELESDSCQVRHVAWPNVAQELAPLFPQVFDETDDFPLPDEAETEFILDWLSVWPLDAYIASNDDIAVGYVLLQPDIAGAVKRAAGGRNPLWRPWLAVRSRRSTQSGRLMYGGVLPEHRKQGIGQILWTHALAHAKSAGWKTLTIGPVSFANNAGAFIKKREAVRRQSYRLFATEI